MRGRSWAGLALLLSVAFLVRMSAAVVWQHRLAGPQDFFFADSHSYWHLARTIANGEAYQYGSPDARVFRTPGYPLVLAPIFWLAGPEPPVLWARAVGAVLGLVPVGCCWWLGRRLFGTTAGWLAGLAAAFYPEAVAGSMFVLSEAAFCPGMWLQMVVLVLVWQTQESRKTVGYAFLSGVLGGLATLVRPSWFFFTPLVAVLAIFSAWPPRQPRDSEPPKDSEPPTDSEPPKDSQQPTDSQQPKDSHARSRLGSLLLARLEIAAGMLVGMILVMLPWWIRNYRVIGRFVPTTLQVGASLYDGLHPQATGKSDMQFVPEFAASERWLFHYRGLSSKVSVPGLRAADPDRKPAAPEAEQPAVPWEYWLDRAMWEEAVRWAANHPQEVFRLAWVKLRRMWNPWPNEPALAVWPNWLIVAGTYLPVLLAGLMGLVRSARRGWPYVGLVLPAVYLSLVHSIFVSSIRYRLPAMFGWMVLGAGWLAERAEAWRRSRGTFRKEVLSEKVSLSEGSESHFESSF